MKMKLLTAIGLLLVTVPAMAQDQVLNIYNWSNYIAPDTIANFEAETGIKVTYTTYAANEEVDNKLQVGNSGFDIVVPTGNFLQRQIKLGFILPLDKSKLSNLGNLDPAVLSTAAIFDPDGAHSVPYMINTIGYGYNVDKVKAALGDAAPTDSWDLLFKPENAAKLADCGISLLDSPTEVLGIALHYLGLDANSESPDDIAKAEALLGSIKPYVRMFTSDNYINALANGDFCLSIGYSGDVFQAQSSAAAGVNVQYVIPKEGAATLIDFLAIPADAPNPENALKFIDYILKPDVVAAITNAVLYANPNLPATPLVNEAVRNNPGIYPPAETLAKAFSLVSHSPEFEDLLSRTWTRIKTGV